MIRVYNNNIHYTVLTVAITRTKETIITCIDHSKLVTYETPFAKNRRMKNMEAWKSKMQFISLYFFGQKYHNFFQKFHQINHPKGPKHKKN